MHDAGTACICPVRKKQDRPAEEQQPAADHTQPAPAAVAPAAPEQPAEKAAEPVPPAVFKKYTFFVYMKAPGDRNFSLANIHEGTNRIQAIYAPRYTEDARAALEEMLDCMAAGNPGFAFQIRRIDNRRTVFTSDPERALFTPDRFAELFAA